MNTQPGPVCPHCQSARTVRLAGIPGAWCRCPECARYHQAKPPRSGALDDMPDRPSPVSSVAKLLGRIEVAPCVKCRAMTTATSGENGDQFYCHHCRLEFAQTDDGDVGYGRPSKRLERRERKAHRKNLAALYPKEAT